MLIFCKSFLRRNLSHLIYNCLLPPDETSSTSITSTQPFQKAQLEFWKLVISTNTRNNTPNKSCTAAFKEKSLLCNIVTGKAVITSAVAGGMTLNPIVFASLTDFSHVLKAMASFKIYDNFTRIDYKKILDASRFYLRVEPFNEKDFLR